MTYKALMLDLDGTLIDTRQDVGDSMNRVLAAHGFPTHPAEAYGYFLGDGARMVVTRALPEEARDEETIETCLEEFNADYGQNWNVKTSLYDGVAEMLDTLEARGYIMTILSNKPHHITEQVVTELLPDWRFDVVFGQREGVPRKPDPAGAIEVAKQLNIPPAEFLYLGDTAVDMKTAAAAGMFAVGVLWGFRPAEELEESGAEVLIESPSEIFDLLD